MKSFQQQMFDQTQKQQQEAHKRFLQWSNDQQRAAYYVATQSTQPRQKGLTTQPNLPRPQAHYVLQEAKAPMSFFTRLLQILLSLLGLVVVAGALLALVA